MNSNPPVLPPDIAVFERGWLSSNNILLRGAQTTALIDSGYASHAAQTVALVRAALGGRLGSGAADQVGAQVVAGDLHQAHQAVGRIDQDGAVAGLERVPGHEFDEPAHLADSYVS